jgi:hypothetical protein
VSERSRVPVLLVRQIAGDEDVTVANKTRP